MEVAGFWSTTFTSTLPDATLVVLSSGNAASLVCRIMHVHLEEPLRRGSNSLTNHSSNSPVKAWHVDLISYDALTWTNLAPARFAIRVERFPRFYVAVLVYVVQEPRFVLSLTWDIG